MSSLSRREFLHASALTGASLVIAFYVPRKALARPLQAAGQKPALPEPNTFVRVGGDDSVTVLLAHSEMGQGIWTTLPMLVAEELGCDWSQVRVEHAPVAPAYRHTIFGIQMTGGSTTTRTEFDRYRTAGAVARDMLVRAAAQEWKVDPRRLHTDRGAVVYGKRRIRFGKLVARAQALPPPASVQLKKASEWKIIGRPTRRLDSPEKIEGRAKFGIDVQFPDLRTAVVARAPVFGATLKSVRDEKARSVPGVESVVRVPSGVAVVARDFWSAKRGRDVLEVDWDLGPGAALDSDQLLASYRALAATKGSVALAAGDPGAALGGAAKRVEADYDVPYLAHAPMEPLNCTVKLGPESCEIWTGTQFQSMDQSVAARISGLSPEKVTIHTTFLGGGFGRRATPVSDFVSEAVQVAKASGVPVKVVWTRDDDIRGGYYRPLFLHRIQAGLDAKGRCIAWNHVVVGQSLLAGTPFEGMIKNGIDDSSIEGTADSPYLKSIAAKQVSLHSPTNPVPVLWWRSVGNTHTAFAMESMIDELAHAAGQDPLQYRTAMLRESPRHARALQLAAEKAGWGRPAPEGHARGLAVHESFGSIVAQVAEVSVERNQRIRVHRVTCAIDCGLAVNPLAVEAQVQGSVAFGLGPVLTSKLTLKNGRVQQRNFHDYQVLRINQMPTVEVHIVKSDAEMGGVGEPATAPISAAVANAVFALTGQRLRSLPLQLA
jgi:isoquinoline 1-oxidoreductase beta subunit